MTKYRIHAVDKLNFAEQKILYKALPALKSKVFFGQEPPNGKSTTTILWGQLSTTCSNVTEVAQWAAPSCSRPQPATDNGVRDGRSN